MAAGSGDVSSAWTMPGGEGRGAKRHSWNGDHNVATGGLPRDLTSEVKKAHREKGASFLAGGVEK